MPQEANLRDAVLFIKWERFCLHSCPETDSPFQTVCPIGVVPGFAIFPQKGLLPPVTEASSNAEANEMLLWIVNI